MRFPGHRPAVDVAPGERLLAWAERSDGGGVVGGSKDALYVGSSAAVERAATRIPWEQVATAEWDSEDAVLRVVEMAPYGEVQPVHEIPLGSPDRLLQLVRERITATFVVQRYVEVTDGRGARIIGRRPPSGGAIRWFVEYDEGLDPAAPWVAGVVEDAVEEARAEVGE